MKRGATLFIGTLPGAIFSVAAFAQESGAYLGGSLLLSIGAEFRF